MPATPTYQTLRSKGDLKRANDGFLKALTKRATKPRVHAIGTRGGSSPLMTWYSPSIDLWVAPDILDNRTWNALGNGDPFASTKGVAPTLEINFPLVAGSSSTAGLALADDYGVISFAHTGRIGGGKAGIGKARFREFHPWTEIVLVDGVPADLYMLGNLDDPDQLAANVSDFVKTVADLKAGVSQSNRTPPEASPFKPEFEGVAEYEVTEGTRRAVYAHGRVVNGLYQALKELGVPSQRTKAIDLFCLPTTSRHGAIFEVKTSTSTQAIFTCVGQLLLLAEERSWMKVAVLPTPVPSKVAADLEAIGVTVLPYTLDTGRDPVFHDLSLVVDELAK